MLRSTDIEDVKNGFEPCKPFNIKYIEDKELIDLLDERTKDVMKYRKKYPEVSFNELAEIISMETGNKIGKSGINHCFIKIRELVKKHQER